MEKLHQAVSDEKDESTVIGKAAEVQISEAGKKLLEDDLDPLKKMCQTDFMAEEKHDRCPGRTDGNADHLRHAKCRRHQRGTGTGKEVEGHVLGRFAGAVNFKFEIQQKKRPYSCGRFPFSPPKNGVIFAFVLAREESLNKRKLIDFGIS